MGEQAVTEMTAGDEEIAEYVAALEERGDAEVDVNEALSKVDGDALAAEFERYLRRRGPGFRGWSADHGTDKKVLSKSGPRGSSCRPVGGAAIPFHVGY